MANRKRKGANHARQTSERRRAIKSGTAGIGRRLAKMSRVISAVTAGVAALAFVALNAPRLIGSVPFLKVSNVNIEESLHAKKQDVLAASGVTAGMMLADVNPARIAEAVRKNPWVEQVIVKRRFPGKVTIMVRERTPVALVSLGRISQIDREGVLLDLPAGPVPDLLVVTGLSDTVFDSMHRIRPADMRRFMVFRAEALAADPALFGKIAQADFSRSDRIRLLLSSGPAVIQVESRGVRKHMQQLWQTVSALAPDQQDRIKGINLCYENLAFVEQADTSTYER